MGEVVPGLDQIIALIVDEAAGVSRPTQRIIELARLGEVQ